MTDSHTVLSQIIFLGKPPCENFKKVTDIHACM